MDGRPILVATDVHAGGAEALRQGHAWAHAEGRPLWVMLELPRPDTISMLFPQQASPLVTPEAWEAAERLLRQHVDEVLGAVDYEVVIRVAGESDEPSIVQTAREIDAAAIVLGTSGKDEATRALLGGHAEPVIDAAPCPVLVARPTSAPGLVIALAEPHHDSPILELAQAAARVFKGGLLFLLAREGPLPAVARDLAPKSNGDGQSELESARVIVDSELRRRGILADMRTVSGDPVDALRTLGEQLRASLLVVRTPAALAEPEGAVAQAMVREAPCSVLVLH